MGRPKGSTKSKKRELDAHFDYLLFLNVFKRRNIHKGKWSCKKLLCVAWSWSC
ncbi:hypothetical protein HYD74_02090 [Mycoplasmopsis bovis]|nr:hypothetical protein HYD74_02090 [Mycoplasmopsis bovis]